MKMTLDPNGQSAKPDWRRNRWRWISLGAIVCVIAWVALAIGLLSGVGFNARLVLVTVAAFATEGLFWLAAALLGISVFEARHAIWNALRQRLSRKSG